MIATGGRDENERGERGYQEAILLKWGYCKTLRKQSQCVVHFYGTGRPRSLSRDLPSSQHDAGRRQPEIHSHFLEEPENVIPHPIITHTGDAHFFLRTEMKNPQLLEPVNHLYKN